MEHTKKIYEVHDKMLCKIKQSFSLGKIKRIACQVSSYRKKNNPISLEPRHEKTYLCHMRTTKAHISLRIRAV